MSDEITALKESITEVLLDLMTEIFMSKRRMSTKFQASSTRGVQASLSTARAGTSQTYAERRTKNKDDIASMKLVPSILPAYIPPLSGDISRDSVPRDFEYTLVIAYLSKRVRTYRSDQDKVVALKFWDFNLGDHKFYNMLSPYKYLTRTKGKNSNLIPQQWMMNLVQSTLLNIMKIPHFSKHEEVNACVKLLLSSYHKGYMWLDHRIIVYLELINNIIGLRMQGPNPHEYYPRKTVDCAFVQNIKESYGGVEKGARGYKVASIESGVVWLACQLIAGKLVRKNQPTQVFDFLVDLAGKCTQGLHMNYVKYLVNQLEIDYREAQDQGHEFHFRWLLILITFVAWKLL
jgi:hypothetical protein